MPPGRSKPCGNARPTPARASTFSGSAGTGPADALARTLNPALRRLGAVRDQPGLGILKGSHQLGKFEEGEKRAKGTGLPLPSSDRKILGIRDLVPSLLERFAIL